MKTLVERILIVFASGVVTLLGIEVAVAIVSPQQLILLRGDIWRPDDLFGYRHRENADTEVNTGEGTVRFITDDQGFRVTEVGRADRVQAEHAILLIGDSFVAGLQVENEETIGGRVEAGLGEKGFSVRVDNAGVNGWTPNHYLLEARRSLRLRAYDLGIVCLYVGNDVVDREESSFPPRDKAARNTFEIPPSLEWIEFVHAILLPINDILETRSHLFILIKERLRPTLLPMVLAKSYHPPVFNVRETGSRRWALTAGICKRIADEFAERSVPVIFVLIPTIYQVREDLWPDHLALFNIDPSTVKLSQPNVLLGGAFETEGLTLLDPLDVMRREAESGNRHYGSIDPHLNRRGNRSVAEFILPSVEAALSGRFQP